MSDIPEVKTIDFFNQGWGHQLHGLELDPVTLEGHCMAHSRTPLRVGDRIRFEASYGIAECVIIKDKYISDPSDMYSIDVRLVYRQVTNPAAIGVVPPVGPIPQKEEANGN